MDINWILDSPQRSLPVGDPESVALSIEGRDEVTYRDLSRLRDRWVALLLDAEVNPGDRVGIMLLNSVDYVALYFAIAKIGAIAVRINHRLAPDELLFVVDDAGCKVVVLHASHVDQIGPINAQASCSTWLVVPDHSGGHVPDWATLSDVSATPGRSFSGLTPSGSDPVMLMYSSGTTGRPKGVVWTHDQLLWLALMQSARWGYNERTVAMTTGPFYHAGAFEVLLLAALFMHGKAVAMGSGGVTTERILEVIRKARPTHVHLFSFTIYEILREDGLDGSAISTVRSVMAGGDIVHESAVREFSARFPDTELGQAYGLTEGGTMSTYLDHRDRFSGVGSVGGSFLLTDIEIRDENCAPLPPGDIGEIWVRSNTMTSGYWNRPEATAETFVDGWCRTGDIGRATSEGFLQLTGRAKDMIRSGAENIYPAEVEKVLLDHAEVATAAVVAVPDATYLEVGCAVIVAATPDIDESRLEKDLRALSRDRLAGYKCPKHYVFVDELPVNHSGKIQKNLLRRQYEHLGAPVRHL